MSATEPNLEELAKQAISFFVREVVNELQRLDLIKGAPGARNIPVQVDAVAFVRELSSRAANAQLQDFFIGNHRFVAMLAEMNRRAAVDSHNFADEHMPYATFHRDQMRIIEAKKSEILALNGHILDLGVYKGGSTKALAGIFPTETIHGFDSFEGLPGDWTHALKGAFGDVKGALPDMPANVKLYKGWFEDTLPVWLEGHRDRPISLLRVDCDIYSSTKTIFDTMKPLIRSGTWIVFDELIGYRGWRAHEHRAFQEFIAETGFEYEYVSFGLTFVILYLK